MEQIDIAGEKIFSIMINLGYWAIAITGIGQIIASVSKKDVQGALRQVLVYGSAFAAMFLLRWMLDLIRGIFS